MKTFEYVVAEHAESAMRLAAAGGTYLAGGTNLVDLMKLGVAAPDLLVDVTSLPYDFVQDTPDGGVQIGATVRNSDLAANLSVRRRYPVLSQALLAGASGQLRNMATVGGNLLQRTRCAYFTDVTLPCNKREPGSGCPARAGDHRNLAILGGSEHCIATNPSDMAVALTALDAVIVVHEPGGARELPISQLYRLPGHTPDVETSLAPGTLITAVELPALPIATNSRYRKVRDRASYAFAVTSVAAALSVVDGEVADVRIALGGVAPLPWRAWVAEDMLRGGPATASAFRAAAEAELASASPLPDNAFKVPLARELIVSILTELSS